MKLLDERLIVMDADVATAQECIRLYGQLLMENGYVNDGYTEAVVAREMEYPTGLPGDGISIAIPHTNNTYVNKPCIAVIIPRRPISFGMMGTKDDRLECELVLPLVIKDSKMQIAMLQEMMKIIQDKTLLKKIRDARTKNEILGYLHGLESCMPDHPEEGERE